MKVFIKRNYFAFFSLFISLLFLSSSSFAATGIEWLSSIQNENGSFSAQNDTALPAHNTSEVLRTLNALGEINLVKQDLALQFINSTDSSHLENITRKIVANSDAGRDVNSLITQLKSFLDTDGGFASIAGYQSTVHDTALAIQALAIAGVLLDDDVNYAISFITKQQKEDGSWSSAGNISSVYITATVSLALQQVQAVYDVASNVNEANNYLLSRISVNPADLDVFETALSLLSIAQFSSNKTTYQSVIDFLNASRDTGGSWNQDVYTTALAIHALNVIEEEIPVEEDLSPVLKPSSVVSAVTGIVTDNLTGQPLVGALVNISMQDGSSANTSTNSDGQYLLSNLPSGGVTISIALSGYHSVTATSELSSGQISYYSTTLISQPEPVSLSILGKVIDVETGQPLADVTVQIASSSLSTQTTSTGEFQLNDISPGSITVQISNSGYVGTSSVVSAPLGGNFDLGIVSLKPVSEGDNFGSVTGIVTDAVSGEALYGATVTLSGSDDNAAFTDIDGRFLIANVNPGSINLSAALSGYTNATGSTDIVEGGSIQFNVSLVKKYDQAQVTLQGSVIDAETQQALSGVSIQIADQSLATTSFSDGQFQFGDIASGSFNVTLSLEGYDTLTYSVSTSGGELIDLGQVSMSVRIPVTANQSPVITSRAPVSAQVGKTYSYAVQANDLDDDVITYSFISKPEGMSIDASSGVIEWIPTITQLGIQSFTVLVFDNQGGNSNEEVFVDVATGEIIGDIIGDSEIYVITDVQTLEGLNVDKTVPDNYVLANYVSGGRNDITISTPACPIDIVESVSSASAQQVLSELERLTGNVAQGLEIGAGEGTIWGDDVIMDLSTPQNNVVLFPIIDNLSLPEEGIEFTVWGSDDPNATFPVDWTLATLVSIYKQGYAESSSCAGQDETDNYASLYAFDEGSYQYMRVRANNSISIFKTPERTDWSIDQDNGTEDGWQSIKGEIDSLGSMICSTKPIVNAGADILGRTRQAIQFDASATQGEIVTYSWDVDNDNVIDMTGVNPTYTFNAGFDQNVTLYAVNEQGCVGIDTVHVTIDLDFPKPDLIIETLSNENVSTNLQTLQVNGSVQVAVKNIGLAPLVSPASITLFEDTNTNGVFDVGVDNVLGSISMSSGLARNDVINLNVPLMGSVDFRDSPIYAMVDSEAQIIESNEKNNHYTTVKQCRVDDVAPKQIVLQEKWHWDGLASGIENNYARVLGPVIVGQLNDDNGDGQITTKDTPDLIFVSYNSASGPGTLRTISGADGSELWSSNSPGPSGMGSLSLGDIDNDGFIEIVGINAYRTEIFVYEHTGEVKWVMPTGPDKSGFGPRDAVAIADLDHDGSVELIHGRRVYDRHGNLKWEGTRDYGGRVTYGHLPLAADVDNEGDMEVIAGRTLYDSKGNVIWHQSKVNGDGLNAVGNFDDDDFAEIVTVASGNVYVLEHTGDIKWGPVRLPGGGLGGAPTVADFDGDGQPEIGVAGSRLYTVFETNGAIKWSAPIQDASSNRTGSSLFDFESDGRAEILYADEENLFVYDGSTGEVRLKIPNKSGTTYEYPVVVDIDNDNQAEIVIGQNGNGSDNGVRVFESGQGKWAPTRSIWNQHSYHINNINDDGSIPQNELPSWLTHNSYRLNTFAQRDPASLADITASLLNVSSNIDQPASISLRIGNGGELAIEQTIDINFYEGNPASGGKLLGTVTIDSLASGAYQDVVLSDIQSLSGNDEIYVIADSTDNITECNELNNSVTMPVFAGSLSAILTVGTGANEYIMGTQIPLQGNVVNNSAIPGQFITQLHIEDDKGALIQSFIQYNSDLLAGQASINISNTWDSTGFLTGTYQLRGQLFDLEGKVLSTSTSLLSLTTSAEAQAIATLRTKTDRVMYNTSDRVIIDNLISNISTDTVINDAQLRITISNKSNPTVFTQTIPLSVLAVGNHRQQGLEYAFTNQEQGLYWINAKLLSKNNTILASAQVSYIVETDVRKAIAGDTEVQDAVLYRGQQQVCTDNLSNIGDGDIPSLTIQQLLVEIDSGQVRDSQTHTINIDLGSNQILIRNINTSTLDIGDYACTLQADINGALQSLDFAAFTVTEPPINLDVALIPSARGRLLVLIDNVNASQTNENSDTDPHGPVHASLLSVQRSYLTQLLDNMGWSYTLVDTADNFTHELRSGGYSSYALLSEQVKLPNQVLEELREAVYRGEGLLVAGSHDIRNSKLIDTLGIKVTGKDTGTDGLILQTSSLHSGGTSTFAFASTPLRISSLGAEVLGSYNGIDNTAYDKASNVSVTRFAYGEGTSIFVGFDLLAQAAKDPSGNLSLFGELIVNALNNIDIKDTTQGPGTVRSIELSLTNIGSATPGKIEINLPIDSFVLDAKPNVQAINNVIHWSFDLDQEEQQKLIFWLQLPQVVSSNVINTQIFTGLESNWKLYEEQQLSLLIAPTESLANLVIQIAALNNQDKSYKQANRLIGNAQIAYLANDFNNALTEAVRAAGELAGINTIEAQSARLALANVIRQIALQQ